MSVVPMTPQAPFSGSPLPTTLTLPAVTAPDRVAHTAPRQRVIATANRRCVVAAWADDPRVLRYLLG